VRGERAVIVLDPALPGRLAGLDYEPAVVRRRLEDVGCTLDGGSVDDGSVDVAGFDGAGAMRVTPPSWRPDLRRPVDLVEEVVRLEGYERLPSTVPRAPAGRGLTRSQRQRRALSRALASAGWSEVLTYPFTHDGVGDALLLPPADLRRPSVRLANPVSDEDPWLRASLLPGLLTALVRNVGRGFADVALYELGPVFRARSGAGAMPKLPAAVRPDEAALAAIEAALPDQPVHLAAVATGAAERGGWWGQARPACWADAIEAARVAGRALGVELEVAGAEINPWHPGRCAELKVAGVVVGHAGELHPRVIEAFDLPARTVAMEVAVQPLLDAAPELVPGPMVSAFPPASLDVAVVTESTVPAADVEAALRAGAGPLLESIRLFDVYTGDQVGEGHRSIAFTLRLRATDRTLTAEEAVAVRDAAVAEAARRTGATLRG
jgi:phenylalanyl-tRNA synthetase beta chain